MGYRILFIDDEDTLISTVDVRGKGRFESLLAMVKKAVR